MKKYILGFILCANFVLSASAFAAIAPPPFPTSADDCKKGGWKNYEGLFKNQGDCVSFIATDGRNQPDGPAVN